MAFDALDVLVERATDELLVELLDPGTYQEITRVGSYYVVVTTKALVLHAEHCEHRTRRSREPLEHQSLVAMFRRHGADELGVSPCVPFAKEAFDAWYVSPYGRLSCEEMREELTVLHRALAELRSGEIGMGVREALGVLARIHDWNAPTWREIQREVSALLSERLRSIEPRAIAHSMRDPYRVGEGLERARSRPTLRGSPSLEADRPWIVFFDPRELEGVLLAHWGSQVAASAKVGVLVCSRAELQAFEEALDGRYLLRGDQPVLAQAGSCAWLESADALELLRAQLESDPELRVAPASPQRRYLDRDLLTIAMRTARDALALV